MLTSVDDVARAQLQRDAAPGIKFPGIAYTFFVEGTGLINRCHPYGTACWHSAAKDRNRTHVGLCYAGDNEPNAAQLEALRWAVHLIQEELGRSLEVEGHRSVYPTACPGPTMEEWLPYLVS